MPICASCGAENPEGFRFCGRCGSPLVEAAPERRKTVTLLFCDVVGSTALGERLEAEAVREVLLGELTYRLTRQAVTVEPIEPLALKGKENPVPAYRLIGVAEGGTARLGHAAAAFVGRRSELASLRSELTAAVESRS